MLVGESTRRATEPTIVYEDAGAHELKGKTGPVPLWRALRVVSGARGALKSEGLEAPFVGRDRELRQIKDLFHACAEERRAHLVSVTGIAGIGKSRLAWEFYKYFDGLAEIVYWHRGRCLSYGEGVTYWALADMVRMRCRITEDEAAGVGAGEAAPTCSRSMSPTPRSARSSSPARAPARPRGGQRVRARGPVRGLAAVLRAAGRRVPDGARLRGHAVGRRVAARLHRVPARVVAQSPIFVVTLARPGAASSGADLGRGQAQLHLDLPRAAVASRRWRDLLAGLVPGPARRRCATQILARAEGVPLYAVETVRMLLDRGAPRPRGQRLPADRGRSRRWRCRRRCTR